MRAANDIAHAVTALVNVRKKDWTQLEINKTGSARTTRKSAAKT